MTNKDRKNLRLTHYDYSLAGAYFITIVTQNRMCLFGSIVNGKMILSNAGHMVDLDCHELPLILPNVLFESYIIMPNHFHAVVIIDSYYLGTEPYMSSTGGNVRPMDLEVEKTRISLPHVVKRFKSLTTRRYIDGVEKSDWPKFDKRLWQRNYYEHVIRDEIDYEGIAKYILVNPQNWEKDLEKN